MPIVFLNLGISFALLLYILTMDYLYLSFYLHRYRFTYLEQADFVIYSLLRISSAVFAINVAPSAISSLSGRKPQFTPQKSISAFSQSGHQHCYRLYISNRSYQNQALQALQAMRQDKAFAQNQVAVPKPPQIYY